MEKYFIHNENGNILFVMSSKIKPENSVPFVEHSFFKAKINLETNEITEGATEQEIQNFNKIEIPEFAQTLQIKEAMIDLNYNPEIVDNYIKILTDWKVKQLLIGKWYNSNTMKRNDEMLISLATNLYQMTSSQIDKLFLLAVTK